VEALRKKERQDETQFTTKIDGFLSFIPRWMLMYFFAGFLKISPCYDQTQSSGAVFSWLYEYLNVLEIFKAMDSLTLCIFLINVSSWLQCFHKINKQRKKEVQMEWGEVLVSFARCLKQSQGSTMSPPIAKAWRRLRVAAPWM
jgi:hypothetical protein